MSWDCFLFKNGVQACKFCVPHNGKALHFDTQLLKSSLFTLVFSNFGNLSVGFSNIGNLGCRDPIRTQFRGKESGPITLHESAI